jgi:hypothetical protein
MINSTRICTRIFSLALIFCFLPVAFAEASNFTILTPTAGQAYNEGDILWVHWSGTLSQTSGYYGYGNTGTGSVINMSVSPSSGYSYGAGSSFDIGVADASTTTAFKWIVPKGIVSYFKGATQYKVTASNNGQNYYSGDFYINGSVATPATVVKKVYQSSDVQCKASATSVSLGTPVTYRAVTANGVVAYLYRWSGNVPDLNASSTSVIYPSLGTYHASLNIVDSGYNTWYAPCDDVQVVYSSSNSLLTSSNSGSSGTTNSGYSGSYVNGVYSGGVNNFDTSSGATKPVTYTYAYNPGSTWSYNPGSLATWGSSTKAAASSTALSASSTVGCVDLQKDLFLGVDDATTDVSLLQTYLVSIGDFDYSATGFFGLRTQAAVKKFQGDVSINQTGYAGPKTRAKLKELTCSTK